MTVSDVKEIYLNLPQNLTLRGITAIQQDILDFLGTKTSPTISVPDDCQVDLSFIQVIEAARIHAKTSGKTIALASPAKGALLDVLKRGGLLEGMSAEDMKFWLHEGGIQ